jgi:hypothetical protein
MDIIAYNICQLIGINLAKSSDTSKFLSSDGVDPRPGGYVMRPTNKLFLFALIIFLLFDTAPIVLAVEPTSEDFDNASFVTCDDPPISHYGEIKSPAQVPPQVDYYAVDLVDGQFFAIDLDAEKIGSPLDSISEVFDAAGNLVAVSVESSNVPAAEPARSAPGMDISPDPYLEMTVDVDGTYYLAISAETPGAGADTGSYTLLLECSDQPPSPGFKWPVEVGDLLGATGSNPGSLINITPETAESSLPFDLGVGPIIDIEFDPGRELVFAAVDTVAAIDDAFAVDAAITVDYIPARIVAIDPNSGNEVESYNLETELVVALEAAEKELYGIQVDPFSEEYSLVLVTFDDSDLTATLTPVFSFGKQQASALAYHQSEKVMYAASGTDLLKINLESSPVGMQEIVKLTDLSFAIASIDFSHEDVLYVIDVEGNLYEVTDLTTGEVRLINPISVTGEVSGLTFVVGEPTDVDPIKTICSSTLTTTASASSETNAPTLSRFKLKRNPLHRAIGLFKFEGIEGETVTINAVLEQQESAEAAEEESSLSTLKNRWLNWHGKGRVFLGIRDSISDVDFRARKKSQLPLNMSATLPANGTYYVMVIRPLLRFYKTDYCLTLESDYEESQAWKTFDVAWPSDESEDNTASTSAEE